MPTYIMPDSESAAGALPALERFFSPESVAIFGATEATDSAGRAVMANLLRHPCGATLFPIDPKRKGVLGVKAYPSLEAAAAQRLMGSALAIDLAIVTTPAPAVPGVIRECAAAGVKGAIILSAGFRECGPGGAELEQQVLAELRGSDMRVLGPNSLGVACPRTGLNATFAPAMVRRGSVGFLSQSGALLTALLSPDLPQGVGCSAFVSLGTMVALGWAEWLAYFGEDPQTEIVGIWAEAIGDVRSFLRAVRKVTPHKPVILVKGRRAEVAGQPGGPTGLLAEREDVLDDLFRSAGVLRVETIQDLLRMADILATRSPVCAAHRRKEEGGRRKEEPQPSSSSFLLPPSSLRGRRLTIVTNVSGLAVHAIDALRTEGGELTMLAPTTAVAFNALLPAGNLQNPIDVRDDADAERFARAAAIGARDSNSDALLLLLAPHVTIDALKTAELVSRVAPDCEKPILACWMWGAATPASLGILEQAGIPTFPSPEAAVRALGYLWRHGDNLSRLHEGSPPGVAEEHTSTPPLARRVIEAARCSGRTRLTGSEARQLLGAYSLPAAETLIAADHDTAVGLATTLGYPVALAPFAEGGLLRGDVEGLRLHADDPNGVRRAYRSLEATVGNQCGPRCFQGVRIQPLLSPDAWAVELQSMIDPQLGPVMRFSAGGPWAQVAGGHVLAVPPLTRTRVRQLFGQSPLWMALQALYGRGEVDLTALERFLVDFSRLVVDQRWIREVRIAPLLASRERLLAVDPVVVLHGPDVQEEQLPELVLRCDSRSRVIAEPQEPHLTRGLGLVRSGSGLESEVDHEGLQE
jgi:acetyltransferase